MIFVTTTQKGDQIHYHDTKRHFWLLSVISPLVPTLCALAIIASGNMLWSIAPILVYFLGLPIMDILIGEDNNNPPEEIVEKLSEDQYYRRLLYLASIALWANFLFVAFVIGTMSIPFWAATALTIGAGIASGSGLTVAHELGHKSNKLDQWGAKLVAAITAYGHFMIEHNRGHHVHVATPEDAASARLGDSLYQFAWREIPTVAKRGWQLEAARLEKKGLASININNDVLQGYAIAAIVALVLLALFGWIMLPFLLLHHATGWFQLTMANYVEHYGLKRHKKDNGRFMPCEPRHSWNTNHIVSNLILFHLQRHSDHHTNPLRPYQSLRNFEELPQLPSGYPGSFALASIPPLWRKVMDPKVFAWAEGKVENCNVAPGKEDYYEKQFAALR